MLIGLPPVDNACLWDAGQSCLCHRDSHRYSTLTKSYNCIIKCLCRIYAGMVSNTSVGHVPRAAAAKGACRWAMTLA